MDSETIKLLLVILFFMLVPVIAVTQWLKLRAERRKSKQLAVDLSQLKAKVKPLWQYQEIDNVQKEIDRRTADAEAKLRSVRAAGEQGLKEKQAEAAQLYSEAKSSAQELRLNAKLAVEKAELKSVQLVASATQQAGDIVSLAQKNAIEIAGDALEAKGRADEFSRTAQAMKNLIQGYGDEYLIPNHSALDDLADQFDHKQAGQELKSSRSRSKDMIKHGTAADCDYVEVHRRKTAIEFVLDAFNGKVESILSTVKSDNYGKLEQAIKDAYQTVNHNGQAFRNARINELYRTARLRELKWSVAAHELLLQEREEQRQIRELMREEEKVRREIEKTIKNAEKEERLLQKAMDAARKELGSASEEERIKLEQQLAELQQKYNEAEEKNQRALSMAQQTRRGHVYVISNEGSFGEKVYKIGMTRRLEPMDRVKELGDASVPFPFDVHAIINTEDAPALENELHKRFSHARLNKVNLRKEYFSVTLAEVRQIVQEKGIEARWTMTSEAVEYRESRAMTLQAQKEGARQLA